MCRGCIKTIIGNKKVIFSIDSISELVISLRHAVGSVTKTIPADRVWSDAGGRVGDGAAASKGRGFDHGFPQAGFTSHERTRVRDDDVGGLRADCHGIRRRAGT